VLIQVEQHAAGWNDAAFVAHHPEKEGMVMVVKNEHGFLPMGKINKVLQAVLNDFLVVFNFCKCDLRTKLNVFKTSFN